MISWGVFLDVESSQIWPLRPGRGQFQNGCRKYWKMLNFGTKHSRRTIKVSFPTIFWVPSQLVILLWSIEFKKIPSDQCQGQIIRTKGGKRCKKVLYFPNNESNKWFICCEIINAQGEIPLKWTYSGKVVLCQRQHININRYKFYSTSWGPDRQAQCKTCWNDCTYWTWS